MFYGASTLVMENIDHLAQRYTGPDIQVVGASNAASTTLATSLRMIIYLYY